MELNFDVGASLDLLIGKHADALAHKLRPHKPIINRNAVAGNFVTGQEMFLDLGSPNTGRIWEVTSLTLAGIDDNTPATGAKVSMYFGDTMVPSLSSLAICNLSVPSWTEIGTETLWCESTANVVIGVTGATAGQQIVAIIQYRDWPEESVVTRNGR